MMPPPHETVRAALLSGLVICCLALPAAQAEPVELLANPGFEEAFTPVANTNSYGSVTGQFPSSWTDNSRYSTKHTANTYAAETAGTVSGTAFRVTCAVQDGYSTGALFEMYQPFLAVTQRSYTASAWLKASSNVTVSLIIRLKSNPYTVRASTSCAVTPEWKPFSTTALAVSNETLIAVISLNNQPATLWVDEAGCKVLDGRRSWFVSPDGSDANSGSLASPFLTFARAMTNLNAGDILCLRGGTYRETLQITQSGTRDAPLVVTAYQNEPVTLSGCDAVPGPWSPASNGIYAAAAAWTLGSGYNQLFADGVMQHEARHPDHGAADLLSPNTAPLSVSSNYTVTCSAFDGKGDLTGARFYASVGSSWSWQTAWVASNTTGKLFLNPAGASVWWWPNYANKSSDTGKGFLYGLPALLDADGEWHLQTNAAPPHALSLRLAGGADPSGHLVEMKRRPWCIDINGQRNIVVSNLAVRAGAIRLNGDNLTLEGCDARHLSHYLTFTSGGSQNGGRTEGGGILVSGTGNTVRRCTVRDTAGSGILVTSGSGHLITRNHIFNTDYSATYATGLTLSGTENTATFNTVHDSGRDLVQPTGKGIRLLYNDLYHAGRLCKDLGAVYAWGTNAQTTNGTPSRIAYNWVHDSTTNDALGMGIYIDNYSRNFQIDHNVVWNFGDAATLKWSDGLRLNSPADGLRLLHNTLFRCRNYDYSTYTPYHPTSSVPDKAYWTNHHHLVYTAYNNLYMTNSAAALVNAEARDFRPAASGPALDPPPATRTVAWTTTNGVENVPPTFKLSMVYKYQPFSFAETGGVGVAVDADGDAAADAFCGSTPDSGAYEAGGPYWVPGVSGWALESPGLVAEAPYDTVGSSATARGTLVSSGATPASVFLHWGAGDAPSGWPHVVELATAVSGTFRPLLAPLAGLQPLTLYGYRFRAVNASGEAWSDGVTFTSGAGAPDARVWDAGAGTNQSLAAALNWDADATPGLNGSLFATFASAGATARVDRAAALYGLAFSSGANFTLAEGGAALALRAGGISASLPSATSRTYTLACDALLADRQTWLVTNSGAAVATLDVTGRISDGLPACGFTKTGDGTLSLRAPNTYAGQTIVSNGLLAITHADALGATNAGTVVRSLSGGRLQLGGGLTVAEPLTLNGERANSGYSLYCGDGSNVWSGPLTRIGQTRINVASGATLVLSGGATGGGGLFVANAAGTLVVDGRPLLIGNDTFWADSPGVTLLAVASNVWGETVLGRGTLRMGATNALPAATKLKIGLNYAAPGTLDLNGYDQTVAQLLHNTPTSAVRVITSARPATLTVTQSVDTVFDGNLTGAVRLRKAGAGTLTLAGTNLTASGGLWVSGGTLAVTNAATLGPGSVALEGGTLRNGRPAFGALAASNLVWDAAGALSLSLAADGSSHRLALSGALARGAGSAFTVDFNRTGAPNRTYTLATFAETAFTADVFRYRNLGPSPGAGLQGVFAIQGNALTFRTFVPGATVLLVR